MRLGFIPEFVHFGNGEFVDVAALLVGFLLNVVETGDEFAVGTLQGVIGPHVVEACRIDEREEQVAKFFLTIHIAITLQLDLDLLEFLTHLVPNVLLVLPVEAHVGGLLLDALGLDERGLFDFQLHLLYELF